MFQPDNNSSVPPVPYPILLLQLLEKENKPDLRNQRTFLYPSRQIYKEVKEMQKAHLYHS